LLTNAAEHARLKDHVAGMDGGLEAKIHEGYVLFHSSIDFRSVKLVLRTCQGHKLSEKSYQPFHVEWLYPGFQWLIFCLR
jgi:hypothetical protein